MPYVHRPGATRFTSPADKSPGIRVMGGATSSGVSVICRTCGCAVKLRKDGSLMSHRVGTRRKNSWPCPGSYSLTEEIEEA